MPFVRPRRVQTTHALARAFSRALAPLAIALPLLISPIPKARAQCPPTWIPGIGNPGTTGSVNALAILPSGEVVSGGGFAGAGGIGGTANIARYNPATGVWSPLGTGTNGTVHALALLPGGDLVVGGLFTSANGLAVNNIARVNPTTGAWSAMGSGVTGGAQIVRALAVLPDGNLAVAGEFLTAGGIAVGRIARFHPFTNTWSSFSGAAVSGPVHALATHPDSDLVVGGLFTTLGPVAAVNVARLNTSSGAWSALSTGTNTTVRALTTLAGGDIIAGGDFTSAGGFSTAFIGRYSPLAARWFGMGGMNGSVLALTLFPNGDLLAAGGFTLAGGTPANRIARSTPGSNVWSPIGSGLNSTANAAAIFPGGDILVGGGFTTAGGSTANRIARAFPGLAAPTITQQPQTVTTIAGANVYFSISITTVSGGGTPLYQWRKNGVPINTISNPSAATSTLLLPNVQSADLGNYSCLVANSACPDPGIQSNPSVSLRFPTPGCITDVDDGSGTGTPDGGVTIDDLLYFLLRFEAGC